MATNPFKTQIDDLTTATQVKPVTTAFDESKSTAGRVDSIIAKDSPLMQRAAAKANRAMNARGLMNSSMAVGAGQSAVMDAAMPIAQQDASLFQQAQLANQNAQNQGDQFNASIRADIGTKGMSLGESGRQFDASEASKESQYARSLNEQGRQFDTGETNKIDMFGRNLAEQGHQFKSELGQRETQFAQKLDQDVKLAGIDRETRTALIDTEAKYKTEISSNENIANAWATTMRDISTINNNPDLSDEAKRTMISNARGGFESFTTFWGKATGGAVDVSDLLSFDAAPAAAQSAGSAGGGLLAGNAQLAREALVASQSSQGYWGKDEQNGSYGGP